MNLRGLGASRTLVLIDGKRAARGRPDLLGDRPQRIPAPLIQRVEVLSGGASSIYGSDAIAGVVNFIMNDHFEGVQFDWNANGYNHQQHNDRSPTSSRNAPDQPVAIPGPGQRRPRRPERRTSR